MAILYTFIIPHKNIPDLLRRCLDSIPRREDIQIIVVDDNSDPSVVDFYNFPGVEESCVEVYFTKEGKGAGYARNIGLRHAEGKWLLFADADDFFLPTVNDILDKYANDLDKELIFFQLNSVYSDTLQSANRCFIFNRWIRKAHSGNDRYKRKLSFYMYAPWAKMIKRELVTDNDVFFDETLASNDVMFSIKCAFLAKYISVDLLPMYCVTIRHGSLCYVNDRKVYNARLEVGNRLNIFLREIGKSKYHMNVVGFIMAKNDAFIDIIRDIYNSYKLLPIVFLFIDVSRYYLGNIKRFVLGK